MKSAQSGICNADRKFCVNRSGHILGIVDYKLLWECACRCQGGFSLPLAIIAVLACGLLRRETMYVRLSNLLCRLRPGVKMRENSNYASWKGKVYKIAFI
jgi:hypothetical protein